MLNSKGLLPLETEKFNTFIIEARHWNP